MFLAGGKRKGLGVDLALLAGWKGVQQVFLTADGVNETDDEAFWLALHGPTPTLFAGDMWRS